jgi:hypothetical protein
VNVIPVRVGGFGVAPKAVDDPLAAVRSCCTAALDMWLTTVVEAVPAGIEDLRRSSRAVARATVYQAAHRVGPSAGGSGTARVADDFVVLADALVTEAHARLMTAGSAAAKEDPDAATRPDWRKIVSGAMSAADEGGFIDRLVGRWRQLQRSRAWTRLVRCVVQLQGLGASIGFAVGPTSHARALMFVALPAGRRTRRACGVNTADGDDAHLPAYSALVFDLRGEGTMARISSEQWADRRWLRRAFVACTGTAPCRATAKATRSPAVHVEVWVLTRAPNHKETGADRHVPLLLPSVALRWPAGARGTRAPSRHHDGTEGPVADCEDPKSNNAPEPSSDEVTPVVSRTMLRLRRRAARTAVVQRSIHSSPAPLVPAVVLVSGRLATTDAQAVLVDLQFGAAAPGEQPIRDAWVWTRLSGVTPLDSYRGPVPVVIPSREFTGAVQ